MIEGNAYEHLTTLQQIEDVEQYIRDFKFLTAQIPKILEPQYFTCVSSWIERRHQGTSQEFLRPRFDVTFMDDECDACG